MDWARIALALSRQGDRRGRCLAICLSVVVCVFCIASQASATDVNGTRDEAGWADCSGADASKNISVSCYGIRIVRRIVQQFLERSSEQPDLEIFDGVSLVEVEPALSRKGKLMKGFGSVGNLMQFLEGRELRIKLPALLPQNLEAALQESLPVDQGSIDSILGMSIIPSFIRFSRLGFSKTRKRRRFRGRRRRRRRRFRGRREERRRWRDDDARSHDG